MAQARGPGATLVGPFGRPALRIGRVFGIEVGLDFTWIFIFLLITLSLSQQLEAQHETWSVTVRWTSATLASLLFFASILLHELGHSLVSKALGLPVLSITLFLFGGIASLSGEPRRPRDAFLIAAAGPAVSFFLGFLFIALCRFVSRTELPGDVTVAVCRWLGSINLLLAVFNLFPGFPLDGGHILRAGVWAWTGSLERATRVAAALGTLLAGGLIVLGILIALLGPNLLNGLWLVFVGWFVLSVARSSSLGARLESRLGAIRSREIMLTDPPSVSRAESVAAVIEGPVLQQGMRWLVVRDHEEPVGLVTLREIKGVPPAERANTPIGQVMLPRERLRSVREDTSLRQALRLMREAGVSQLPVLDGGDRLVGVLTRERLLQVVQNQLELAGLARRSTVPR